MSENVFAPPRASLDVHEGPEALWDLTWKELRRIYLASVNIRALGVLYGLGAVGAIAAGSMLLVGTVGGAAPADSASATALLWALVVVLGFIYIAACVTSYSRPRWGRWLGIVLCVLSLFSFPFGTVIGLLGLIAYAQGGKLFGPDRFLHKDVAAVYKQRKKDKQ